MAEKVVLEQDEINAFTENLILYHKEITLGIEKVRKQVGSLNANGNIFTMDKTSQKIDTLLSTIDEEILPRLKNTLWESNQCADLLIQIMNGLDS